MMILNQVIKLWSNILNSLVTRIPLGSDFIHSLRFIMLVYSITSTLERFPKSILPTLACPSLLGRALIRSARIA